MERFNYPNLAAVYDEDAEIFAMLEAEQYGYKKDMEEKHEQELQELELEKQRLENGQ